MIQSVERALELIEIVSNLNSEAGLSEIAEKAKLKVQTTNTLLKTLVAKKYLNFDKNRRKYSLGLEIVKIANKVPAKTILERISKKLNPILEALYTELGEQLLVTLIYQDQFFVVGKKDSEYNVSDSNYYFITHPHHLATGSVLLAFRDEEYINDYIAKSPNTNELMITLKKIKKENYYEKTIQNGNLAIALPVANSTGNIVMSVGCYFSPTNKTKGIKEKVIKILKEAKRQISEIADF